MAIPMKGADFIWDEGKLDRFITNPDEMVPGNNMKPYGGLASTDDRAKASLTGHCGHGLDLQRAPPCRS